ncbi:beta-ketoacyl synthase N-terminal-like domain-containing protein [Neisseria sp. CCUG12390]|uniref:beta-ketoacyl synthase N-terminal-like domain-containing protein n=1 Tax=Neisseria sp. CCUG12390 TaxID=3392035 RepID=UPI003A102F2E
MMYLAGQAVTCAFNPQQDFRRPVPLDFRFLQQNVQTPYFRAFQSPSLSRAELADLAERHLRDAADAAGWPSESWKECSVFIGSASYNASEYENGFHTAHTQHAGYTLLHLADDLEARSGNREIFSLATACTSSAHAVIQAANFLRKGTATRALVLGVESLNRMTLLHFHSLGLFGGSYRPFGGNGLILGEGMAALAFSVEPPASSCLKLTGHAANTGSDLIQSNGQAQENVMRRALNAACAVPEDILAVKTHGVGTADSDTAEMSALTNLFPELPPLLAFKPQIGHTLGAACALETALLAQSLQQGHDLDYSGNPISFSDGLYLANHFGFGGSNTSMVWQWTA